MTGAKGETLPIQYKWDGIIHSPRKLFRLLHDFLDQHGYEHKYHELSEKLGTVEGTATFWDELIGKKDYTARPQTIIMRAGGIILIMGSLTVIVMQMVMDYFNWINIIMSVVILIIGMVMITVKPSPTTRKCIKLHIEGETCRVESTEVDIGSSNIHDMAYTCRVVCEAEVGVPETGDAYGISKLIKDKRKWEALRNEFQSLLEDFERVRTMI